MEYFLLRDDLIIQFWMNPLRAMATRVLKAWLVRLCSDLAIGRTGFELLDVQLAELEKRCAAIHRRIDREYPRAGGKRRTDRATDGHSRRRPLFRAV